MCLEETVIIPMRLNNGFPYYVVTFVDDRKLQSMHLRIFFHRARIQPWYIRRSVQGGLVSKDAGGSRGKRLSKTAEAFSFSPTATIMSGPRLPAELLDHIADLLRDRETLESCCLVSKSWIPRARKHLFACVAFHTA